MVLYFLYFFIFIEEFKKSNEHPKFSSFQGLEIIRDAKKEAELSGFEVKPSGSSPSTKKSPKVKMEECKIFRIDNYSKCENIWSYLSPSVFIFMCMSGSKLTVIEYIFQVLKI